MSGVSDKLNYKVREYNHPSYRLHRAVAQNGGAPIIITPSGGNETIFEIPPEVFNLSHSFIRGRLQIPGGAVSRNTWLYNSQMSLISDIQLYNAAGVLPCDLKYANNYTDIVSKAETKLSDFLTYNTDAIEFLERNNANLATYSAKRYDGTSPSLNYTEHNYLYWRAATDYEPPAAGPPPVPEVLPVQESIDRNFLIDLKKLKNTIFSYDKDLFFNEKVYIRIRWASTKKIYFTSGVAVINNLNRYDPGLTPEEAKGNVTLNDVQLYLSYETNDLILNAVKSQWSHGIVYKIPYVISSKTSNNSTTQNVTIPFAPGSGRRLLKIYHALYNTLEEGNTAYDHSNSTHNRLNQYYTQLNQVRRQQFDVDVDKFEDYMLNRDRFVGSLIQNNDIFDYNHFILDDFTEVASLDNNQLAMGYDLGIPITPDLKWDIYCKVNNALLQNHFNFAIVTRDLYVGPSGMRLQ